MGSDESHFNVSLIVRDSVVLGLYSPSYPHLHTPFPPSLISLMVYVDVKHYVYFVN